MKTTIASFLLVFALAACVPSSSDPDNEPLEAPDLIVWNAPSNKLEGVLLGAMHKFDPSLEDARVQDGGSNRREVISLGLERRKISLVVSETVTGTRSYFTLEYLGTNQDVTDFAAKLEQALLTACNAELMRLQ